MQRNRGVEFRGHHTHLSAAGTLQERALGRKQQIRGPFETQEGANEEAGTSTFESEQADSRGVLEESNQQSDWTAEESRGQGWDAVQSLNRRVRAYLTTPVDSGNNTMVITLVTIDQRLP